MNHWVTSGQYNWLGFHVNSEGLQNQNVCDNIIRNHVHKNLIVVQLCVFCN
jgi:hypothetical protein